MFTSILNSGEVSLSMSEAGLCVIAAILLGLVIGWVYMACGSYSKNFVVTLVMLPVLIQVVIMMVNGNLGTGVAVLGAFSLIRFRSVPGSSREIVNIFFSMAVGLAAGTGYLTFALFITAVVCLVQLALYKSGFGEKKNGEKLLKIVIPENLDYETVFDDIFGAFTKTAELERVKTTNLGSMYELDYRVFLKEPGMEKEMLDEIRCRNGNLTVVCGRTIGGREEL